MKQSEVFMQAEGNAWFARNREQLGKHDPVSEIIEAAGIRPTRLLEVGCANGWRLQKLAEKYRCETWGVEPSMHAMAEARANNLPVVQCDAADLRGALPRWFDLVIYGFCLYLTDPQDWFQIVAEGDRVLADGGHIVIHDFSHHWPPYARRYGHRPDVLAYHVNFAHFWLAHPCYSHIRSIQYPHDESVVLLKKFAPAIAIKVLP